MTKSQQPRCHSDCRQRALPLFSANCFSLPVISIRNGQTVYTEVTLKHAIIVMGVSGCGKSTIGEALAQKFGLQFIEGDRLHPAANVEKMAAGNPLNDDDRWPWLTIIGEELRKGAESNGVVISCSALKQSYRDHLRAACVHPLNFVYLEGSVELLTKRMGARTGHFMPLSLLKTQLDTLESPTGEPGVATISIDDNPYAIVENAAARLTEIWTS
jgi:gluconokinase